MATRHEDWLKQAKRDLQQARNSLENGVYEWCCFAAQQAAEKAVKALFQKLGADAWGHSVNMLLLNLPESIRPKSELIDKARHSIDITYHHGIPIPIPLAHLLNITRRKILKGRFNMQTKSSDFVKIRYLDKAAIMSALTHWVDELSREYPKIEEIRLFGSLARDEAVPGSDVDILIVLAESDLPFNDRIEKYMPSSFPVGIDVFPYTELEIETMLEQGNYFLKSAMKDSILLFSR